VGGAIARLDERRRAYVAALKAQPKAIDDLFRVTFRQPAEALKEQIRAPLTAWEEELRLADEETNRLIGLLNAPIAHGTPAAAIRQRLEAARDLDLPDWLTGTQRGEIVAAMERNIPRLETALEAASRAEEQAAELARLRAVARDAELLAARKRQPRRPPGPPMPSKRHSVRSRSGRKPPPPPGPPHWRRWPSAPRQRPRQPPHPRPPRHASAPRATGARRPRLDPSRHPGRFGGSRHPHRDGKRLITAIARGQVFHLAITY
jgi:hypothetical protein